jgi:hypothetical protein
VAAVLIAGPTFSALAGSGVVNNNGTIDITINLRFPPTAGDVTTVQNQVTAASTVLWDASEGQLRFGNVNITAGAVNEDLADMWVFAQDGRAGVGFLCDGTNLQAPGVHVNQFLPSSTGGVLAHEFGHLALGLGDEYSEQKRFGACWGYGQCIETAALTEQNQCLMQQAAGFSWTEFCTAAGHDQVVGEGIPCTAGAAPCTTNCQYFNPTTGLYETSQQTAVCGGACWTQLVAKFTFLTAPAGLPVEAAPAGMANPVFTDNTAATDTVLLVLDRSGSMFWNTESDNGEVCGNGTDDDGDGTADETDDCTQSRFAFVKAAARAWLELANGKGVKAGIVSFNDVASQDAAFQEITAATLPGLQAAVDGLAAGGETAIGRALSSSTLLFSGQAGALNKTAFLISDGVNTVGETPQSVFPSLQSQGIRVFTVSTGGASDDTTLSEISGATKGSQIDSHDASALVAAFARQWASYRNTGVLIPQLPYSLNQKSELKESSEKADIVAWATHSDRRASALRSPKTNSFYVHFEEGTETASVILAGNMGEMAGFGVEATLEGPAGPGPTTLDSTVASPSLRVVRDNFFLLLEVTKPNPGDWKVVVHGRPGAAQLQTGNVTILADNPKVDLFTSLDRHIVNDLTTPVRVRATPIYSTTLRHVDLISAQVKRPDGSLQPLNLQSDFDSGGGDDYSAVITDMPFFGMYEVRIVMRTGPNTTNDPGEAIFAPAPANTVPVPVLERAATQYFFVTKGEKVPRPGGPVPPNPRYCSPLFIILLLFLAIVLIIVAWLMRCNRAALLGAILLILIAIWLVWFCCRHDRREPPSKKEPAAAPGRDSKQKPRT